MRTGRLRFALTALAWVAGLTLPATAPPALAGPQPWPAAAAPARGCVPNRNLGCADHGRFSVAVSWHNQYNDTSGAGLVVTPASTDETLAFSFGDPANIELLVKLLDFGDVVKLFYGELTNLQFQITVADTAHGTVKVYGNTPGNCGALDGSAFPGEAAPPGQVAGPPPAGPGREAGDGGSCRPSAATLCLLGGRFAASVTWQNQFDGVIGQGVAGPLSSLTGTFYFTDPTDKELLVKVLDFGDHVAIFYGSLSNLQYSLQVTDTSTGATKTYFNPPGSFCGGLDDAFPSNLTASTSFTLIPVSVANSEHLTDDIALVPFTITSGGTLQVDADWMSAADNVHLVLFAGDCTLADAAQNLCNNNQIAAARGMVKPQQLTQNLSPGTYTIMVINVGPGDESGSMTATLMH